MKHWWSRFQVQPGCAPARQDGVVELGIASAGIKRPGRKDVVVMRCAEGSTVAGVFTLNAFCAGKGPRPTAMNALLTIVDVYSVVIDGDKMAKRRDG